MRPSRDRQNRSFFSARARKAPGKQWHVVVVAISPPGEEKKNKKRKKKRALARRVCAGVYSPCRSKCAPERRNSQLEWF
jgi:hypothetical protein